MQFDVNVRLIASPELLAAINNLAAAFTAEGTITRAASRRATTGGKENSPANSTLPATRNVGTDSTPLETPPVEAHVNTNVVLSSAEPAPTTENTASSKTPASGVAKDESGPENPPTVVEVRSALAALVKTNREKAVALLAKYGAASVSALKPEHYSAVLEEAKQ